MRKEIYFTVDDVSTILVYKDCYGCFYALKSCVYMFIVLLQEYLIYVI